MDILDKRNIVAALALMITACAACGIASCNANREASSAMAGLVTQALSWNDSIGVGHAKALCKIRVRYPESGPEALVDSVRVWIAGRLSDGSFVGMDDSRPLVPRGAALSDGSSLVDRVGKTVLSYSRRSLMHEASVDSSRRVRYEYYWDIEPVYDTGRFVTYMADTYCYLGGAHGGASACGRVFRSSDGRHFGWDMFRAEDLERVREMVVRNLYSQQFDGLTDRELLRDRLLVDPDSVPLPVSPPYFMEDGVHFVYQQYEISPYSEGMPGCRIPYGELVGYMTPGAASLVEDLVKSSKSVGS